MFLFDIIINEDIFIFFFYYNLKINCVLNEDNLKKFVYLNLIKLNFSKNNEKFYKMINLFKWLD